MLSQAIIFANIVFSCTILFFTFLLVYGIINFSRFKFAYVIGIYSGTVAGIIAMLFAYRLRPQLRLKIALMIVSVFLAIYGTEAILPIDPLVPLPNFRIFEEKGFPRLYDKRTRLQVIKALGREGIKAYPALSCALWGNNAYLVEKWRKTFTLARLRLLLGLQADKKDFIIPCPPFCHKLHKFNPLEPRISYTLRKILNEANQNTKSWGGQFYFVYLPSYNSVRTNLPDDYTLSLVRELNIPVINMLPIFTALSDPLSIFFFRRPGTHYNADGHKLVADTILKSISVRDN